MGGNVRVKKNNTCVCVCVCGYWGCLCVCLCMTRKRSNLIDIKEFSENKKAQVSEKCTDLAEGCQKNGLCTRRDFIVNHTVTNPLLYLQEEV